MVDTRVGRPTLLPSYRVTERRCTGHSSGHSMHDCANPAAVLVANSYVFLCVQMQERNRLRVGYRRVCYFALGR